jgi:uncharacterized membrane protein YczE
MAVGVGIGLMVMALDDQGGAWSAGLIPFLIGCVLLGFGLFADRGVTEADKEVK